MTNQTPFDRAMQQQDALFNEMLTQIHARTPPENALNRFAKKPDDYTVLRSNGIVETKSIWISEDMRAKNLPLGSLVKVVDGLK